MIKQFNKIYLILILYLFWNLNGLNADAYSGPYKNLANKYITFNGESWEKISSNGDNIEIFETEIPNTGIYAFRGISVLHYPIKKVLTIGADIDLAKNWTDSLAELKVIRHFVENNVWILYARITSPFSFIISDRDFIFKVKIEVSHNPERVIATYQSLYHDEFEKITGQKYTENNKYVRGDLTGTTYRFTKLKDGLTLVDFEVYCNPKGYVPGWIVNFFQKKWPNNSINRLKEELEKGRHGITPFIENLMKKKQ